MLRFSPVTQPCSCRQSSNISSALLSVSRNAVEGTAGAQTRGIGKKCHQFLFQNAFSFVQRAKNSPSAPSDALARSSSAKGGRDKPFPGQKHAARGQPHRSLSSSTPRAATSSPGLLRAGVSTRGCRAQQPSPSCFLAYSSQLDGMEEASGSDCSL